jgi:hypothetical protein
MTHEQSEHQQKEIVRKEQKSTVSDLKNSTADLTRQKSTSANLKTGHLNLSRKQKKKKI